MLTEYRATAPVALTAEIIQKYRHLSTPSLKRKAIEVFNAWIRNRDHMQPCIGCGKYKTLQAGHYFSAGKHNQLRFDEDNVHGECLQCNYYESGHLLKYRANLLKKIGPDRLQRLEQLAAIRMPQKDDRLKFIEVILTYAKAN